MSIKATINQKRTRRATELTSERAVLNGANVVVLETSPTNVVAVDRFGQDARIRLRDGSFFQIDGFFKADATGLGNDLVFKDPQGGLTWWVNPVQEWGVANLTGIESLDPLLLLTSREAGISVATAGEGGGYGPAVLGGLAGLGLLALALGGGGGKDNPPTQAPAQPRAPQNYTDDVGPKQSVASTAPTTDDTRPAFLVDAPAQGQTLQLIVDGAKVTSTYDAVTGRITPTVPLTEGQHAISYTVVNANGAESLPSAPFLITIDTTAPVAPATPSSYIDNVGPIQSLASTAAVTDDNRPGILIGAVPAGVTPELFIDGAVVSAIYDAATGAFTPNNPVSDGLHRFSVRFVDDAGNVGPRSGEFSLTIDTVAPVNPLTPTSYNDDVGAIQSPNSTATVTDDNRPGINIGAVPAGASALLLVDNVLTAATYNATTGTLTPNAPVADGAHNFAVQYTDVAGNLSAVSGALAITIDTQAPNTPQAPQAYEDNVGPIQSARSTAPVTDDNRPGLLLNPVASGETPVLFVDGVRTQATYNATTGTLTPDTAVSDGLHAFSYAVADAAGNTSGRSPDFNLTIDTSAPPTPPTPTRYADDVGPVQSASTNAPITDDARPGVLIGDVGTGNTPNLFVDGVAMAATYDAVLGTLTPNAAVADGARLFSYTVSDAAGNTSAPSGNLALTIDTTPPSSITVSIPEAANGLNAAEIADGVPVIVGLPVGAAAGDVVSVSIDGSVPVTLTLTAAQVAVGNVQLVLPTNAVLAAGEGPATVTTTYTNSAGVPAVGTPVNTPVVVDTVAPPAPATPTQYADNVGPIQSPASSAAVTDDNQPGILVTVPADTTPVLYIDGVQVAATFNATEGTLTPNAIVADGLRAFSYALVDAAGNMGPRSGDFAFTIDTVAPPPPPAPTQYADDVGAIQATATNAPVTDDDRPGILIAPVPAGTTAVLLVDGVITAATYNPTAGTLTPDAAVAQGPHAFSYLLQDTAGNRSPASGALNIDIQPVGPSAYTVTIPEAASGINAAEAADGVTVVVGLPSDAKVGDVISVSIDGSAPVRLTLTAAQLSGATVSLQLSAADVAAAGQGPADIVTTYVNALGAAAAGSPKLDMVTIDTVSPPQPPAPNSYFDNVGPVQNLRSTDAFTDDNQPGINIVAPAAGETPQLFVDGALVAATFDPVGNTLTPNVALADGPHTFAYRYVDATGNVGGTSNPYTINIITTPAPPATTVNITAISEDTLTGPGTTTTDFITVDRVLTVVGTLGRALATGEVVQVRVDGGPWQNANTDSGTNWFLGLGQPLAPGGHSLDSRVLFIATGAQSPVDSQPITIAGDVAPEVGLVTAGGLLGLIGLDALGGLLPLGVESQSFAAFDINNNISNVSLTNSGLLNLLSLANFTVSTPLAAELGVRTQLTIDQGLAGVGGSSSLQLSAVDGQLVDNLYLNEVLGTVALDSGLANTSAAVLNNLTITATDSGGATATATGNSNAVNAALIGTAPPSTVIQGSTGNDALTGTAADERLYGFAGNDTLNGGDGNDLLRGGPGVDAMNGGNGTDLLIYDVADQLIDGGAGVDVLRIEGTAAILDASTNVRNIEVFSLGVNDAARVLTITGAGLLANNVNEVIVVGDQNDAVVLQGGVAQGQVLIDGRAFNQYVVDGRVVRVDDGVFVTIA